MIDDAFCTDKIDIYSATTDRFGTNTYALKTASVAVRAEFVTDLELLNLFKTQDGLLLLFLHKDVDIVIKDQVRLDGIEYTVERKEIMKDINGEHHLEVLANRD